MATRRQRRVSELVHRELSAILMREVRDPRVAGVTITGVEMTPDLLQACIHFSLLGSTDEENEALVGLEHASGFLRSQLAGRVCLRSVPQLTFEVDKSEAYGRRIDELLDQVEVSRHSQNGQGPA